MSASPSQPAKKTESGTTIKRFHFWVLSGKGQHVGRFPLADGIEPDEYCELHYDSKGVCVLIRELIEGYSDPLVRRPVFDGRGRLQHSDRDGPDAETKLRNSYEYGGDGMLKARQETDRATGKLRWRVQSTYDTEGWPREQQRFEADGKPSLRSVFEVDAAGYFTKETKYAAGKLMGYYVFGRDEQHREVRREWHDSAGKLLTTCVTKYGAHDLPAEMVLTSPDGSILISVYAYDPHGKTTSIQILDANRKLLEEHRPTPGGGRWKRSLRQPPKEMPKGIGVLGVQVDQFESMTDEHVALIIAAGYAQFEKGNFIEALPMFQMAAAKYPTEPYFPYAMGLCCLKLRRFEAAILYYNQALALDPKHGPSLEGLQLAKSSIPQRGAGTDRPAGNRE